MRIIGGEHRGRQIAAPPGRATRPMLDRVREAVFATIAPWLEGALVLDLFAGSGSLGLEALSRGARRARFVERDPPTLRILRDNARALGLEERCTLSSGDALSPLAWSPPVAGAEGDPRYDLAFLDPPYPLVADGAERARLLGALSRLVRERLAPDGAVVLHVPRDVFRDGELAPGLVVRRRVYGTNAILYVGADEAEDAREG